MLKIEVGLVNIYLVYFLFWLNNVVIVFGNFIIDIENIIVSIVDLIMFNGICVDWVFIILLLLVVNLFVYWIGIFFFDKEKYRIIVSNNIINILNKIIFIMFVFFVCFSVIIEVIVVGIFEIIFIKIIIDVLLLIFLIVSWFFSYI